MSIIKIILLALKLDSERSYVRGLRVGRAYLEGTESANSFRLHVWEPENKKLEEMEAELKRLYKESTLPHFYKWLKEKFLEEDLEEDDELAKD